MLRRNQTVIVIVCLFIFAFGIRVYQLDKTPTQNDEQLWLARAYSFVHTLFNQDPEITPITKIYSDNGNVDVFEMGQALVPEQYPFTIRTEAHHPGVPPTLLIGLSYIFLADGSHEASLNLLPTIVAIKLPQVIIGSLLVVVTYLGTGYMFNRRVAFISALVIAVSPLMIGFSRLARIDMTSAFFATCMFFSYVVQVNQVRRKSQIQWALLTGIFAGLGMATNPYAVYIVPIFATVKILLSNPTKDRWHQRFLPDLYDILFLVTWIVIYVFAHPNLWANPIAGFEQWINITLGQPHVSGDGNHFFYIRIILLTTLPSTMLLMITGLGTGLKLYRRQTIVLAVWCVWFLLLLSIPSGKKNLKNILQLSIPMAIWVGIAVDWMAIKLSQRWGRISYELLYRVLAFTQILIGLGVTLYWLPMPHLYITPRVTIASEDSRSIATSHGIKPALDYIYANSPTEPKRFIARTGRNNLMFHLPDEAISYATLNDFQKSDWLIVLPKSINTESAWYYNVNPTHILTHGQIELAYLYYLPDFFPREMIDTSSPLIRYDNNIQLYDIELEQDEDQLRIMSWWGEQPDEPYGFSIQVFDLQSNKVAQGDFLLPTKIKQESLLDISLLEGGEYHVSLIVYDLETATSLNGSIVDTDSLFERMFDVGIVQLESASSTNIPDN